MSLTLSESELVELTGYKIPSMQLDVLRKRGFYRAYIGRSCVILTRAHFNAVENGTDAAPAPRKVARLTNLRAA